MERVKIALLGLGTVGTGVWNIIRNNGGEIEHRTGCRIEIAKALVKDKYKPRSMELPGEVLTTDFDDILADEDIKIIVEVIGGIEPARRYIEKAIEHGRHVVTANKLLISRHGEELAAKAAAAGVSLRYEASVCGGIPIINTIRESLNADKIEEITGIVNGTTNYILSRMSGTGCGFKDALREAQARGFAEADPTSDVEGYDAVYKLRILTKLAYGVDVSEHKIYREGISGITAEDIAYAKELGYEIKLLAVSRNIGGALDVRVHPAMVPAWHSLARVQDAYNAVRIKGNAVGELLFYGKGAGELPTGSAVVNDILNIIKKGTAAVAAEETEAYIHKSNLKRTIDIQYVKFPYYLRLDIKSKTGAMQRIIKILSDNDIRIASMIKKEKHPKQNAVVFLSHEAVEYNMRNAVQQITCLTDAIEIGNLIRLESLGGGAESEYTAEKSRLYS